MFKLGKKPARPGAISFMLRDYANLSALPTPPANFGHDRLVTAPWQMLGNDQYGDCVWAGAAHETMMWNADRGVQASFNDAGVLAAYSAVTGFKPDDPNTDQGTDMTAAAAYRQKHGILDVAGKRHKVGAYLSIQPDDLPALHVAAYLFGTVGIGITFPSTAMDQFNAGEPWDVVPGSSIEGGHYIPFAALRGGLTTIVTWGKEQGMTDAFLSANNDENIVYLSEEFLSGGKSLEGFDLDQLNADLAALKP